MKRFAFFNRTTPVLRQTRRVSTSQMPVMDGYQAARAIRPLDDPRKAALPIVALSANACEEDQRRSSESGMNAHVSKPMDLDLLLDTIQRVME